MHRADAAEAPTPPLVTLTVIVPETGGTFQSHVEPGILALKVSSYFRHLQFRMCCSYYQAARKADLFHLRRFMGYMGLWLFRRSQS
jgi:hypothetical protein